MHKYTQLCTHKHAHHTGLPRTVWATAVPNNLQRTLGGLLEEVCEEDRIMVRRVVGGRIKMCGVQKQKSSGSVCQVQVVQCAGRAVFGVLLMYMPFACAHRWKCRSNRIEKYPVLCVLHRLLFTEKGTFCDVVGRWYTQQNRCWSVGNSCLYHYTHTLQHASTL